jgi:hypothetical protein
MSARSRTLLGMSAVICGVFLLPWGGARAAGETAITIYSSAQPGAIPAEYYRPLPRASV